jgi:hypothetical protein
MKNNKPIIGVILTMIVFYLLISFVVLDINFKHWSTEARALYSFCAPIVSMIIYITNEKL